jgi:hypothetical protein
MRQIKKGSTDISIDLYIIDSTDGTPETSVVYNSSGIDLKYRRDGATVVSITEIDLTSPALDDTHEDGGFLAVGNGSYRFDIPDLAFATAADKVTIFGTITGMIVLPVEIQLVDFDPEDATRLGLTALPDANADAAGGLPISDDGGLDLDTQLANTDEITVSRGGYLDNLNGHVAQTGDNYDRIGHAGVGLTHLAESSICTETRLVELDSANIPSDIDEILTDTNSLNDTKIPDTISLANINAEVDTALITTTYAEPGQGTPAATASIKDKLSYMYKFARNKITNDGINVRVWDDAGTTIDQLSPVTSVGGTVTRGEFISG